MKRNILGAAACAFVIASCNDAPPPPDEKSSGETVVINPIVKDCNTTLPPVSPSVVTTAMAESGLPCALSFDGANVKVDLANLQLAFDFNSWLTFLALNEDWEKWADLFDVMLPGGAKPRPFGQTAPPPAICTGAPGARVVRMISKTPTTPTVEVSGEPLNTGPLIDQNGHYARYQILINRPMYEYIVQNGLYSKAGQAKFADTIAFPAGDVDTLTTGKVGAIVVKVSWKVMDGADDTTRFHTTEAYVYTPPADGVPESCNVETLGLAGIHIVHKTAGEPQWIWSTFEHVDNAPTPSEAANPPQGKRYNFFNPACSKSKCPYNQQAPQPWNPSVDPFPGTFRSQIVRTTKYVPIATNSAAQWNDQFHAAIKGTVWENYELITTQWPTDGTNPTDPDGVPFPLFAANTTMETYVQGNTPLASSTCMGCHGNAAMTNGKRSDFSFVLEKAN